MPQPTIMKGLLKINYGTTGWTEVYPMPSLSWQESLNRIATIAKLRRSMLATGCVIERTSVSTSGTPRDARTAITGSLRAFDAEYWTRRGGPTDPLNFGCNNPEVTFMFSFETATGRSIKRHFRGLPDFMVINRACNPGVLLVPSAGAVTQAMADDDTVNHNEYRGRFLRFVLDNTMLLQITWTNRPTIPKVLSYDLHPLVSCHYESVRSRKTGRPFRLSHGRRVS